MSAEKLKLTCTQCGTAFECGANTHDCWCNDLPNIMPVEGKSCWCPNCLKQEVEKQQARLTQSKQNP